jgi:hypothetical protein
VDRALHLAVRGHGSAALPALGMAAPTLYSREDVLFVLCMSGSDVAVPWGGKSERPSAVIRRAVECIIATKAAIDPLTRFSLVLADSDGTIRTDRIHWCSDLRTLGQGCQIAQEFLSGERAAAAKATAGSWASRVVHGLSTLLSSTLRSALESEMPFPVRVVACCPPSEGWWGEEDDGGVSGRIHPEIGTRLFSVDCLSIVDTVAADTLLGCVEEAVHAVGEERELSLHPITPVLDLATPHEAITSVSLRPDGPAQLWDACAMLAGHPCLRKLSFVGEEARVMVGGGVSQFAACRAHASKADSLGPGERIGELCVDPTFVRASHGATS